MSTLQTLQKELSVIKDHYFSFEESDLREILRSSQSNKLVIFIGSGFSKFSETKLTKIPDWDELISELKEDLKIDNENDYLKIAQLYYLKHGQHTYADKVKSAIKELDPSVFHKQLFELKPHYIITTNWDNLIEKTAQQLGLAYDVISSDVDLAQSQLDRKIIKMHGDFSQHNFVFKEDDYLQYSQNFPLIENYIKGIFSTSTVLFLGYSYSDYNLKQIISWISNISKATPKKFLLQKKFDDTQSLYLRNHGISLLTPLSPCFSYNEVYEKIFDDLKAACNPDEFIKRIMQATEVKITKIKEDAHMSVHQKEEAIASVKKLRLKKIEQNINEKISGLEQFDTLLPEQIAKKFTNCTISYNKKISPILSFPENILTNDYDETTRKINQEFITNFLKKDPETNEAFISICHKAFINAVEIEGRTHHFPAGKIKTENKIIQKIHFQFPSNSIELLLINKDYQAALKRITKSVQHHLAEKNYVMAVIFMANHDLVYNMAKQDFRTKKDNDLNKFLSTVATFDYKTRLPDFPRKLQRDLDELVHFLDFDAVYKTYYKFNINSQEYINLAQERNNGNIAFSNEEYTLRRKLYPYLYFILGNDILIDEYIEIKNLFSSIIIQSMNHYLIDEKFHINIKDLYIIIKYCDPQTVKKTGKLFSSEKKIFSISNLSVKEIAVIKRFLLAALKNTFSLYKNISTTSLSVTTPDRWIDNILILSGFVRWNQSQYASIINEITSLFESKNQSISRYENIIHFLTVHANLYTVSYEEILKVIDIILKKIINNKFTFHDNQVINTNTLRNIYLISENNNIKYRNTNLIKRVIAEMQIQDAYTRNRLISNLLLSIKNIGTDEVKKVIDDFIEEYVLPLETLTPEGFIDRLLLIANDYPVPTDFTIKLTDFIEDNIPTNLHLKEMLLANIESELPNLLEFIIKNKNLTQFSPILEKFNEKMNVRTKKFSE